MPKCVWHECSPVNLLHIFRTAFHKNSTGRLLLKIVSKEKLMQNLRPIIKTCQGLRDFRNKSQHGGR